MPKNFRQIPPDIRQRLQTFELDDVVVASAKLVRPSEIGEYAHLGIFLIGDELVLPKPSVPPTTAGKYSLMNVEGKDIKRMDLPKITKDFSFYAPNWGDSSNGEHLVVHTREVYQRDFIPPKEVELSVTLLEKRGDDYVLKFAIDEVLNKNSDGFEDDVLYNLNVLHENTGTADVFPSDATIADYAATVRVNWELLPVGELGAHEAVTRLLQGKQQPSPQQRAVMEARLATFAKLKPTHFISGTTGFVRYFGAKYDDDFVVFENIRYGNAIYVMFEQWQELSKRSRIDLLKGDREGFERIEHRDGWESRLEAMLENHRNKKRRRR